MENQTYLYRVEVVHYDLEPQLRMCKFPILRTTPCGNWIDIWGARKFVNHTCRKQWAHRTPKEAHAGFIVRRKRQIEILQAKLLRAQEELLAATCAKTIQGNDNWETTYVI